MRIAFFADSYKPYISGVANSIEILTNDLRALGHKVYIFAPSYPKYKDTDPDIFRFPSLPTSYPNFRLAIPFMNDLPDLDIVHAHSPFQAGLFAKYISGTKKAPFVYTFHTFFTRYVHYAKLLPEKFSKLAMRDYLIFFCKQPDMIFAPTNMSMKVIRKWGIKTPCEIVPTGLEITKINSAIAKNSRSKLRAKFGIPESAKVLVYLGRISKEKNIQFLLDAFAKMRRPDLYLLLIGGGPGIAELSGENKKIIFAGEMEHDEAVALCIAGDVFVFSSITETQGLVLAEAKLAGLPIVGLFAGGLIDTVRSGIDGYLVPRNLDDFIAHIERLLRDDWLRGKMGREARQDAIARFDSKKIAKNIETIYNSLVTKRGK